MKKNYLKVILLLTVMLILSSCATDGQIRQDAARQDRIGSDDVLRSLKIDPAKEKRILALDPERITEVDIRDVLTEVPAPHIMNIHGGIYPVHLAMESFSRFLIRMGYPEEAVINSGDGSYSYSCYDSSQKLAGILAWHYEHDGMRPMIVGHSQGGMQAVKVLYEIAGKFSKAVNVWNPLIDQGEERHTIIDPYTAREMPITELRLSYVSAVGAGGLTRLLPNQWSMAGKLRKIPDSVEEFTGFSIGLDFWGGDLFGLSKSNLYQANGRALVRNVKLPAYYNHVILPVTSHLAKSEEIRDWINSYEPVEEPSIDVAFDSDSMNILWAADVWHSIKKHWVIELKQLIKAKRRLQHVQLP